MPVPLTGKDVTAIAITSGGSNAWIFEVHCGSGQMGQRVRGGAYTDGVEVDPAEQIYIKADNDSGTEPLDFSYGDTVLITIDAVEYTVQLDESILANTNYYIDANGVPFTDSALTTFIGIGSITEEDIGTTENVGSDVEYSTSEGIGVVEEVDSEIEYSTVEIINIVETFDDEDEQETHEILGVMETINYIISGTTIGQFTKTSPSSNANWTKKDGDIL